MTDKERFEEACRKQAAKYQEGKWYKFTDKTTGCKVQFQLKNWSADVVRRFNEACMEQQIRKLREV